MVCFLAHLTVIFVSPRRAAAEPQRYFRTDSLRLRVIVRRSILNYGLSSCYNAAG